MYWLLPESKNDTVERWACCKECYPFQENTRGVDGPYPGRRTRGVSVVQMRVCEHALAASCLWSLAPHLCLWDRFCWEYFFWWTGTQAFLYVVQKLIELYVKKSLFLPWSWVLWLVYQAFCVVSWDPFLRAPRRQLWNQYPLPLMLVGCLSQ